MSWWLDLLWRWLDRFWFRCWLWLLSLKFGYVFFEITSFVICHTWICLDYFFNWLNVACAAFIFFIWFFCSLWRFFLFRLRLFCRDRLSDDWLSAFNLCGFYYLLLNRNRFMFVLNLYSVIVLIKNLVLVWGFELSIENGSLVNIYFNFVTDRSRLFRREGWVLRSATLISVCHLSLPFFHVIPKFGKKRVVTMLNIQAVTLT